jgi:hypothetical protein
MRYINGVPSTKARHSTVLREHLSTEGGLAFLAIDNSLLALRMQYKQQKSLYLPI